MSLVKYSQTPGINGQNVLPPLDHNSYAWGTSGTHRADLKVRISINTVHFTTMGNPFLNFFSFHQNAPQKKFRIEIWTFSFQNCFWNQFSTSGSGQIENTQIRVFAYLQFDHFPKSKIDSENIFVMRRSIFLF